jgi:hypothetical protein
MIKTSGTLHGRCRLRLNATHAVGQSIAFDSLLLTQSNVAEVRFAETFGGTSCRVLLW